LAFQIRMWTKNENKKTVNSLKKADPVRT
jgi:hypothetical protein